MQQIGFVGLGAMGSVMAPLPVAAGFSVIAFDTASQLPDLPDITMAAALTDLATCDAIITMLPDGTVVTAVTTQLAAAGFRGLSIAMQVPWTRSINHIPSIAAARRPVLRPQ